MRYLEKVGKVTDSYWKVSGKGLLHRCFKGVKGVLQGCYKGLTIVFHESYGVFQRCYI